MVDDLASVGVLQRWRLCLHCWLGHVVTGAGLGKCQQGQAASWPPTGLCLHAYPEFSHQYICMAQLLSIVLSNWSQLAYIGPTAPQATAGIQSAAPTGCEGMLDRPECCEPHTSQS